MRYTNNPKGSTERVRLHRARKALSINFRELLFKLDTESLSLVQEQIESLLAEVEPEQP
jgi:hypothetical protein